MKQYSLLNSLLAQLSQTVPSARHHRKMCTGQRSGQSFGRSIVLLAASLSTAIGITACGPTTTEPTAGVSETEQSSVASSDVESEATVYVKDGVAIAGADPVAYFTDEQFVPGSTEYTHNWQGTTWQFASAENRDLFASDPETYAPQYGGYCAWAVGQNALAAIDPEAWSIIDGKLYLNASEQIQERWNKDIPGNIALAEANWPELSQ